MLQLTGTVLLRHPVRSRSGLYRRRPAEQSAFNKAALEKTATVLRDPDSPGATAYYQLAEEVINHLEKLL